MDFDQVKKYREERASADRSAQFLLFMRQKRLKRQEIGIELVIRSVRMG